MLFKRKAKRVAVERRASPTPEIIRQKGFGTEMPPQKILVEIYFQQKDLAGQAEAFYSFYEKGNWCSPKGTAYRNWKLLAGDWIFNFLQEQKRRRNLRDSLRLNAA